VGFKGQEDKTEMNAKRTLILTVALAMLVSALSFAPAASARVVVSSVEVFGAPPPLRHEVIIGRPGPRYIWVPGYWNWEPGRRNYVWVGGNWLLPPRVGAIWVGPRVVYRGHRRFFYRGYWR
jgi:hypothetical protein